MKGKYLSWVSFFILLTLVVSGPAGAGKDHLVIGLEDVVPTWKGKEPMRRI